MIYILAGITGIGLLACAAELLGRAADHIGITDKLFRLFDLPADEPKANVIYVDFQNAQKERNA